MGRPLLVDSSFYIRTAKEGSDPFLLLAELGEEWEIATCGVVWAEVVRGRVQPPARERFNAAFGLMEFLPTTDLTWAKVAQLAWSLDRRGAVMQVTDLTIATCALEAGASLLSFDRDFLVVPGLDVRDSFEAVRRVR